MGSNKPLLEDHSLEDGDNDSDGLLGQTRSERNPFFDSRRHWAILSANVFVLLLNIGILLMISAPPSWKPGDDKGLRLPHSEWIKPALQMELRSFDDKFGNHGSFRGPPRPELDNAWAEILRNYTVRIPQPGWRNATSPKRILTEFQDHRGGIMGTFSFLHNIHCIKEIREFMLPEYYPETATRYKPTVEEPIPVHIAFASQSYVTLTCRS
ncbi:hypothetical protein FAGAP_6307 [Fusarium agapanthi]|uniref:Uncharacterized protein n=1 Tax=Fusarium agapanthi TaxID=1803897 RepID=A0A9P5BF76_9HYPO|nr:hypothetical protein FAGAP_6307 [Fusarium agapanthi]